MYFIPASYHLSCYRQSYMVWSTVVALTSAGAIEMDDIIVKQVCWILVQFVRYIISKEQERPAILTQHLGT